MVSEERWGELKVSMSTTAGVPSPGNPGALSKLEGDRVELEIKNMPLRCLGRIYHQGLYDTCWSPGSRRSADPDTSVAFQGDRSGANYTLYKNEEVDRLLDLGVTQEKVDERKATYARIQEILLEEVPFAPQFAVSEGGIKVNALQGIKPNQYVTDAAWNVYEWSWA